MTSARFLAAGRNAGTTMPIPARRRLTLLDLLVLIAATAAGLSLVRIVAGEVRWV